MSLEYLSVCRLCASTSDNTVPIFEEGGLSNFADKIKYYLHVEIINSHHDSLVPRMCSGCYERIIGWEQFAEKVHKVQGMFSSMAEVEDTNEILERLSQELSSIKDKDLAELTELATQPIINPDEVQSLLPQVPVKRKKHKRLKRNRKETKLSESDFSDEDDIPLAAQLDCTDDALKARLDNDMSIEDVSKTRHRKLRLKIKPVKGDDSEVVSDLLGETDVQLGVGDGTMDEGEDSEDAELDDFFSDGSPESEKFKLGLQSLFTWECLECQARMKNWNALVKHCKEVHECNAMVQCVCGKHLQSRASIMKHRMKHTVGYGYKCDFENCNKTFHRQQLLDVHALSHMPKELQPWMCCKCSRRFHTESLLKQHEKVHLPKEEKLIHPCDVCQKKFCSKSAVTAHVRAVHFGERPFVCDQCGHSFTSKGILHEHLTIHSNVYNFHCKDCNKSFKTKYRLKIHMDTHMETRYQCPVCTLTLNTRRTLRMHLLVHKEDKAFQCTTCGKAFKRSKDLKNHYNLHTGRRPYTCPFCLRTFANGSNCRSHKRRMHPEELKMYEAAVAAGQQPIIFRTEEEQLMDQSAVMRPEPQTAVTELVDDSESNTEGSEGIKYSDEDDKADKTDKYLKVNGLDAMGMDTAKLSSPAGAPLNLQRNGNKRIKEEEEEQQYVQTISLATGDTIAANLAQIAFNSQQQTLQYPIHNIYTFQASGIPAFPGNPFFRQ